MEDFEMQTILIVDDMPENIDILGNVLKNYKLSIALNGEKALKIANAPNPPDLILLDVMMPGISGYEVITRLKRSETTKNIPVIFITGLWEARDEAKGFELGAADYITKPFEPEIVLVRVQTQFKLLEQQVALRQLNQALSEKNELIEEARLKSNKLLQNILPLSVIKDLELYGKTEPKIYQAVSVMFVDMIGFTKLSMTINPTILIDELNEIFTAFDDIVSTYECERIKTIGDGYMAVCGVPSPNPKHAQLLVGTAIDFISYIINRNREIPPNRHPFQIRIGINSGPIIAGVVGTRKYIYDIFGDTVNVAARIENYAETMRIAISENTFNLVNNDYSFEEKELINVKGIGNMKTYLLDEKYTKYL